MEKTGRSSPEELKAPLSALLAGHGIRAMSEADWLILEGRPGRIQGLIFDRKNAHPFASTQVDICFSPWPGCLIRESFGGIGETREDRIRNALETFATNTLHVLLKVFLGAGCGEQVTEYTITNRGVPFTVTDGDVYLRAGGPVADTMGWGHGFRSLLEKLPLTEGTHWVRLYYGQMDRKQVALELLLDNRPWEDAMPAARKLPWPLVDGFLSLRMFMVIQGGVDVGRAAGLVMSNPSAGDQRLKQLLTASGLSPMDASRLIVFLPIAFGGQILDRVGVAHSTVCEIDDGRSRSAIDLDSSDLFRRARALAESVMSDGTLSGDDFYALAGRDAAFKAVNEALLAGSEPKNLRLSPTIIFWDETIPLCQETPGTASTSKRKPWWRFESLRSATRPPGHS